jgi:hypothetical protein
MNRHDHPFNHDEPVAPAELVEEARRHLCDAEEKSEWDLDDMRMPEAEQDAPPAKLSWT